MRPSNGNAQELGTVAQVTPAQTRYVLSVLMPVMNEQGTLLALLDRVLAVPIEKEILIVDDGSTDGTRELLQTEVDGKIPHVRVFYHERNQGKGAAIRTALPYAQGEFCIIQDGDLEYDPQDYLVILKAFSDPNVSAVYGSRFTHGMPKMRFANRLINRLLAWMVRCFYRTPLTDEATCYKAFRTEVLRSLPLTCRRFEFCPEVTAKLIRRHHSIVEVPIRYQARTIAQGKKIRWTDGVIAIWTLIKFRFARF
ncbi:MAG TPA: glycosyltransferase family 2 protein [Chthonomonas sp.]|uniref:glycosyltransferase family 2 protein n=1 Tax=Chthonomonas sp. TaxID=2282153 RepID=UPI002B4B8BD6|nr:glycosyltransferase family 2 protein [Chthonomonas sp.]HLI47580.1 glycosyltransferase family 2 protein [Chthonomonas sp.]